MLNQTVWDSNIETQMEAGKLANNLPTIYPTYSKEAKSKEKHGVWPYDGFDYNITSSPLQSRLQHIYYGQPYARVDLNPMPESTLSPSQGLCIWPQFSDKAHSVMSTNSKTPRQQKSKQKTLSRF